MAEMPMNLVGGRAQRIIAKARRDISKHKTTKIVFLTSKPILLIVLRSNTLRNSVRTMSLFWSDKPDPLHSPTFAPSPRLAPSPLPRQDQPSDQVQCTYANQADFVQQQFGQPSAMPVYYPGGRSSVPHSLISPEQSALYHYGKHRRKEYKDLKLLGSGAEGSVKLCEHRDFGRVALKVNLQKREQGSLQPSC